MAAIYTPDHSTTMQEDLGPLYGLLAEFHGADELVTATQAAYEQGYRCMEAYTPFPEAGGSVGCAWAALAADCGGRGPCRRHRRSVYAMCWCSPA